MDITPTVPDEKATTNTPDTRAAEACDQIDAILTRYQELGLFNGSALVANCGQIILKKGYGLANMEWGIPNTSDTKFRLGSITKPFTATLVMQFIEEGQIDLAAPVTRYLPDYPASTGDRITIEHLLNHTSGIAGYTEMPVFGTTIRNSYKPAEFIDACFSKLELLFEPGTRFSYSNSGYFLLGVILEQITGESYENLLRHHIFDPVGMNDSGYDTPQPLLSKRAAGYDKRFDGSCVNTAYIDMTQPYAAGALYSTVEDLYKFDQALNTEQLLKSESKKRMFTPCLGEYGYGWQVRQRNGVIITGHEGGINGFHTLFNRIPELGRSIVFLNNTGAAPLSEMAEAVHIVLEGKDPPMPKRPGALALFEAYETSGLDAMLVRAEEMQVGTEYKADSDELTRVANHLLATDRNKDALELAEKLAQDNPRCEMTASLLGRAHRANDHRFEAIQAYSRAIELSETPRMLFFYTDAIREISDIAPKDQG